VHGRGGAGQSLDFRQAAGVVGMAMRDEDVPDVTRRVAERFERPGDGRRAARVAGIDEDQAVARLDEVRVDLAQGEFVDAGDDEAWFYFAPSESLPAHRRRSVARIVAMASPAHQFQDATEIAQLLARERDEISAWFDSRKDSLDEIVKDSVGTNTFRAFGGLRQRPSLTYRTWALMECQSETTIGALLGAESQAEFDRWLADLSERFGRYWEEHAGANMRFGPRRKLPNLLLKELVRWTGFDDQARQQLIGFLHVPLDSFSLIALRNCVDDVRIPKSATMSWVQDASRYDRIQQAISSIAQAAGVPRIYFDNLVWNAAHR
jgi:hypothetical protein